MADVFPFAGTRFNTRDHKLNLADLICPPFHVVSPELRKELLERSDMNLVRLESGPESPSDDEQNNRYTRAAESYRDWKGRQLFLDEQRKCFYVYEQEFKNAAGKKVIRRGFIALVKLQDYRSGKVRAHQSTFEGPRADRLRLLKQCDVNTSPVFMLYRDPERTVDKTIEEVVGPKGKPLVAPNEEVKDHDGVIHRLWLMHKKEPILAIHEAMKPKRLYIADGHHRYEAALAHRDDQREITSRRDGRQPYDFIMMFLANAEEEGLDMTPVHRVLARELGIDVNLKEVIEDLEQYFSIKEFKVDLNNVEKASATIAEKLEPARGTRTRICMLLPTGRAFQLSLLKDADVNELIDDETMGEAVKSLDVMILHRFVIARGWIGNEEMELGEDDLAYARTIPDAIDILRRRHGCVAFLLNPTTLENMLDVAESGELLPHRSTFITPKLATGMVLRDLKVGFV